MSIDEHSLIIVSGVHLAKMYEYENGKVIPQPVVHVGHVIYTDNEGFREPIINGGEKGTPSNYEKHDTGEWRDFAHDFETHAKELMLQKDFDAIYLFAPEEVMKKIRDLLPEEWKKKLKLEYYGNFTKILPHELVEKIDSKLIQPLEGQTWTDRVDEAQKILSHPKVSNGSAGI